MSFNNLGKIAGFETALAREFEPYHYLSEGKNEGWKSRKTVSLIDLYA
jgi:hypothetical protein